MEATFHIHSFFINSFNFQLSLTWLKTNPSNLSLFVFVSVKVIIVSSCNMFCSRDNYCNIVIIVLNACEIRIYMVCN